MSSQQELNDQLIDAVNAGDLGEVRRLLAAGADVNARDKSTREGVTPPVNDPVETALIVAVSNENLPIARLLLESGAEPDCWTDGDPYSALLLAVMDNSIEMVKLLVDHGADINWAPMGDNCLMVAYNRGSREMFDYLLKRGADPHKKTVWGDNFYQYAVRLGRERWI
ncbi:MAG: ankyrin repeat domain-containing protein [Armatimonadota bacterium]